jgi:misacylated tRNA(Ala) deacylase
MTRKLFWEDAYLKEFEASVIKTEGNTIILDQTVFYPTGGGQQNDTGIITAEGRDYKVIDVKKNGEDIIHTVEGEVAIPVGTKITGKIDWDRRYAMMRHHTAVHVLGALVQKKYGGGSTGGMITVDKAHLDFDCPQLNREIAAELAKESSRVAEEGHNVYQKFITQEEALKLPDLVRTEPGRALIQKLETVRIVDIENFDVQTDGGTHVANTKEIGKIKLSNFENKGSHRKRIEIVLDG